MSDLYGFPPKIAAIIAAVGFAYFCLSWAPLFLPLMATHKARHSFPRRYSFSALVFVLAYGLLAAFLCVLTLPVTAYDVFVAPQLASRGVRFTDPLLKANDFVVSYWWVLLPPTLLLVTFWLVRKLMPVWPSICAAMAANKSFKPNPLRGSA